MNTLHTLNAGRPLRDARCALLLLHGRGGSAEDILTLADTLPLHDFHVIAPQAPGGSWYPQSFLAPPEANEPALSRSLEGLGEILAGLSAAGVTGRNIYLSGFSQGACLALELAARHAVRFGGIAAFTGGLIGDRLYPERYSGYFADTPVYISSGDRDAHVPLARVEESAELLRGMGALVTVDVYPGRAHTIGEEELQQAGRLIFKRGTVQ